MSFSIIVVDAFEKELKHLSKKYPSIKKDLVDLVQQLLSDPKLGIPIGNDCYKIRMSIASKGKGKSGGARVITHVKVTKQNIYLLSIYDKSEAENITDKEILNRLKTIE